MTQITIKALLEPTKMEVFHSLPNYQTYFTTQPEDVHLTFDVTCPEAEPYTIVPEVLGESELFWVEEVCLHYEFPDAGWGMALHRTEADGRAVLPDSEFVQVQLHR